MKLIFFANCRCLRFTLRLTLQPEWMWSHARLDHSWRKGARQALLSPRHCGVHRRDPVCAWKLGWRCLAVCHRYESIKISLRNSKLIFLLLIFCKKKNQNIQTDEIFVSSAAYFYDPIFSLCVLGGKNNGTVQGVKYFECRPKSGLFVRPDKLLPDKRGVSARSTPSSGMKRSLSRGELHPRSEPL